MPFENFDRSSGIGGSDVPAILGVSPYSTRTDVWLEKTHHPSWSPKVETPEMRWGTLLEPVMRSEYQVVTGKTVHSPGEKTYWAEDHIRYAHIDGIIVKEGIWEGKVPFNTSRNWQDGVPVYVQAQVQHYLAITGEPWCDVSALLHGADFQTYRVAADLDTQANIEQALLRFWHNHVLTLEPPDPLKPTLEYPTHKSELLLVADDDAEELVSKLFQAKVAGSNVSGVEGQLKDDLRRMIGPAAGMTGNGWRIRYRKNNDSDKIDWKLVAGVWRKQLEEIRTMVNEDDVPVHALRLLTDSPAPDTVISLYTTTQPGARPFVLERTND